jgi:hypothetical protein
MRIFLSDGAFSGFCFNETQLPKPHHDRFVRFIAGGKMDADWRIVTSSVVHI